MRRACRACSSGGTAARSHPEHLRAPEHPAHPPLSRIVRFCYIYESGWLALKQTPVIRRPVCPERSSDHDLPPPRHPFGHLRRRSGGRLPAGAAAHAFGAAGVGRGRVGSAVPDRAQAAGGARSGGDPDDPGGHGRGAGLPAAAAHGCGSCGGGADRRGPGVAATGAGTAADAAVAVRPGSGSAGVGGCGPGLPGLRDRGDGNRALADAVGGVPGVAGRHAVRPERGPAGVRPSLRTAVR